MKNILRTSLTRITGFGDRLNYEPIPRDQWAWGDYVVAEITRRPGRGLRVEMPSGRLTHAGRGDLLVGVLGTRHATLQMTGTWEAIGDDQRLHLLTAAGLMGKITSISPYAESDPVDLIYAGHVVMDGRKSVMRDFVVPPERSGTADDPEPVLEKPVILIVGSSMSAGKTTAAIRIIRRLKRMDLRVVGAKFTGAGRYRDILTMRDAGADHVLDFVDAGMPSTVCPPTDFLRDIRVLVERINRLDVDVSVVEAGASPLEPYNGSEVLPLARGQLALLVLCASDPYSVIGMQQAFGIAPDLIGGAACNTIAGRELIETLNRDHSGSAMNFADSANNQKLDELLRLKLAQ